jgi:hypothetical protein
MIESICFCPTLWAMARWLIFRVIQSSRLDLDMLVVRALIIELAHGRMPPTYNSMH